MERILFMITLWISASNMDSIITTATNNTESIIVDSRKMNLKHPHSVKAFKNCYPTGMNITTDSKEKEIDFQCTSVSENDR